MKNISGVFEIELDGKIYEAKCSFGVIERLERRIFEKSILEILNDAVNQKIYMSNIVDVVYTSILAAGEKKLSRDDVGEIIFKTGVQKYIEWYITFLTYALTGETEPEIEDVPDDKKKNSKKK